MDYTEEQRDIIRRMGAVSAAIERTAEAHRIAAENAGHNMAQAGNDMIAAIRELQAAIDRSREAGKLQQRYSDLFREFLDTL